MPRGFQSPADLDLLTTRNKKELKSLTNDKLPSARRNVHNSSCLCRKQKTQQLNGEEMGEEGGQSAVLARKWGYSAAETVIPRDKE